MALKTVRKELRSDPTIVRFDNDCDDNDGDDDDDDYNDDDNDNDHVLGTWLRNRG